MTWQDANSDGASQAEELRSLRDSGVVRLSLDANQQNVADNGNWIPLTSTVEMVDGTARQMADIYFESVGLSSDAVNVALNPNSLVIQGTAGDDILHGSVRDQVFLGGTGRDVFVFSKDSGHDLVVDMTRGVDKIDVSELGITSIEEMLVEAYEGGMTVQLSGGSIKVANVNEFDPNDFIFAKQPLELVG